MDTFRFANETKICEIVECSCSNGDSFKGTKCSKEGTEFCEVCDIDDGYFLNVNNLNVQFQNRSYETLYNDGLASSDDNVYGYDWSETVDGEDHIGIYSAVCSNRTCSCTNGSAAVGVDCPFHGEFHCDACDTGFHLVDLVQCSETRHESDTLGRLMIFLAAMQKKPYLYANKSLFYAYGLNFKL